MEYERKHHPVEDAIKLESGHVTFQELSVGCSSTSCRQHPRRAIDADDRGTGLAEMLCNESGPTTNLECSVTGFEIERSDKSAPKSITSAGQPQQGVEEVISSRHESVAVWQRGRVLTVSHAT